MGCLDTDAFAEAVRLKFAHALLKLRSTPQFMRLLSFVVSAVVSVGLLACESAEPTPIEPSPSPSPPVAPVLRIEPTTIPTPEVIATPEATPTVTPSPTQTLEPTPTSALAATDAPEAVATVTLVPTDTPEPTVTATTAATDATEPTAAQTVSPTQTPSPTSTTAPTQVPTDTPTPTETPSPTGTVEPEPTETAEATNTPTVEPTITATPIAEVGTIDGQLAVDDDTLWGEFFDTFDDAEFSCIQSKLDEDDFEAMSVRPVGSIQGLTDRHDLAVWGCLSHATAVDLYISKFLEPEGDFDAAERSVIDDCYRASMQYTDLARYTEATFLISYRELRFYEHGRWKIAKSLENCSRLEQHDATQLKVVSGIDTRPLNFAPNPQYLWIYAIEWASLNEQACILQVLGPDRHQSIQYQAVLDGSTESWESAVWGCLADESAARLFKLVVPYDIWRLPDPPFSSHSGSKRNGPVDGILGRDDEACLDRVLSRMDFPRLIDVGLPDDVTADDYRHATAALAGTGMCVGTLPLIVEVDDHGDVKEDPTSISIGTSVEGKIDDKIYRADVDFFEFVAEAGLVYEIDLSYDDPGEIKYLFHGFNLYVYQLFDPLRLNGDQPVAYQVLHTSYPFLLEPPGSGAYRLRVSGIRNQAYRINITISDHVDDFGDDVESAHEIAVGETVAGALEFAHDNDFFSFGVEQGATYQIETRSSTTGLRLLYEKIEVDFSEDEGGFWHHISDRVIREPRHPGRIYIRVGGESPGTYSISVSIADYADDHGNEIETATVIELGETIRGVISHDHDQDLFKMDLRLGETFEIDFDSMIKDRIVADVWDVNYRGLEDLNRFPAIWMPTSAGPHFIRVRTPGTTGGYAITLRRSHYVDDFPDDTATGIDFGAPIEVHNNNIDDRDVFTFSATAGESFDIFVEPGTFERFSIRIYDADGNRLKSTPGYEGIKKMTWQAWEDGDYFVDLETESRGTYTISVSRSNYRDDHADDERFATPLTLGETVHGMIGLDAGFFWRERNKRFSIFGDHDMFSFEAERGKRYSIEVELDSLIRSEVQLYDADGEFMDSADTGLTWKSGRSGKRYVRISGVGVGDYNITIRQVD